MGHVADIVFALAVALGAHPVAQVDTARVDAAADAGMMKPAPASDLPANLADVLREPRQVTAVLVHAQLTVEPGSSDTFGFPTRSSTVDVPDSLGRRVAQLVLSQQRSDVYKLCTFSPNIAYAFEGKSGGVVDVAVCHGCAEMVLRQRSLPDSLTARHIDRVNLELLAIGLALFPADTTLQARYGK